MWNRPALRFAIPLVAYIAHPTVKQHDRWAGAAF
jgi:hypothetical protein